MQASQTGHSGGILKTAIGATDERASEECALVTVETRAALRNGLLATKRAFGSTLRVLDRRKIAPLSVQSHHSAEWPFRARKEKVIGDLLDRGLADSDDALADADGPVGALVTVSVPSVVRRHPLPFRGDDDEAWTFLAPPP